MRDQLNRSPSSLQLQQSADRGHQYEQPVLLTGQSSKLMSLVECACFSMLCIYDHRHRSNLQPDLVGTLEGIIEECPTEPLSLIGLVHREATKQGNRCGMPGKSPGYFGRQLFRPD